VFVELPEAGDEITAGEAFGVVESIKAVSDLYAPVSGEVVAVNEELFDRPELVNEDPYGDGGCSKSSPSRAATPRGCSTPTSTTTRSLDYPRIGGRPKLPTATPPTDLHSRHTTMTTSPFDPTSPFDQRPVNERENDHEQGGTHR